VGRVNAPVVGDILLNEPLYLVRTLEPVPAVVLNDRVVGEQRGVGLLILFVDGVGLSRAEVGDGLAVLYLPDSSFEVDGLGYGDPAVECLVIDRFPRETWRRSASDAVTAVLNRFQR